jgi:hypothetical protein
VLFVGLVLWLLRLVLSGCGAVFYVVIVCSLFVEVIWKFSHNNNLWRKFFVVFWFWFGLLLLLIVG